MPKLTKKEKRNRDIYRDFKDKYINGRMRLEEIYNDLSNKYYLSRDTLEKIVAEQRATEKTKK